MLSLNHTTKEVFIKYFKSQAPYEACGILASDKNNNSINIFYPIPNVSSHPKKHFEFDPQVYINTLYHLDERNLHLIGVIHSHPSTSAFPSKVDIKNWFYPNLNYWIYSIPNNQLNAFLIENEQVKPQIYSCID